MTDQLPAGFGAQCRHGGLARVCERCELLETIEARDAEIAALKAALQELQATVQATCEAGYVDMPGIEILGEALGEADAALKATEDAHA